MILTSTTETVPFTPPWLCKEDGTPQDGAPVFHLRAAGVIERGQMEAEISGPHRAGRVLGFELRQAMQAGVQVLLADDPDLDRVVMTIAEAGEAELDGRKLSEEDAQLLKDVAAVLVDHYPEYRDLVARAERRREIAPIVALRRFCTGWENVTDDQGRPVEYVRGTDGQVAELALGRLSQFEMMMAGNRAYSLAYAGAESGNLPRPGSSAKDPQTSPSASASTAAGKSVKPAGKRTRASRSRRGSGPSSTSTS